jgi:hypothetical protein
MAYMTDTQDTNRRIDADRPTPEASPSAGWRETAELMHVTAGLEECDTPECDRDADPVRVVDGDADTGDVLREGARCSDHAKEFLEVSS